MFCPRCGKPIQPGSAFCMHCGQAFAPAPRETSPYVQPASAMPAGYGAAAVAKKQNRKLWALIGLFVLLIIALALGGAAFLAARGSAPAANLRAVAKPAGAPLAAPDQRMPSDIYNWLEHLRITEDKRNKLALDEVPKVMGAMAEGFKKDLAAAGDPENTSEKAPSIGDTQNLAQTFRQDWKELDDFFVSVPPPDECIPIRNEYDQALKETGAEMGDVANILNVDYANSTEAINKLNDTRDRSKSGIDKHGEETDHLVQRICDKYNTRKWFSIKGDIGGSALSTGFPGMGAIPSIPTGGGG